MYRIEFIVTYISVIFIFTACGTIPEVYKSAEDTSHDEAIGVTVSREAIQKKTDVSITIDVKNSEDK